VRTALLLVALLAVAAPGCGGDGGSPEAFRSDALEACRKANDRIRALGTPESYTETQLYARRAEDAVSDQIDELDDLDPPAELQASFELYLATLQTRQRQLGGLADAADENSMQDLQRVGSELDALGATAREQATTLGIAGCEPR
jgi:hypothetical protein